MSASRMREGLRDLRDAGDTTTLRGHGPRRRPAVLRDRGRRPQRRRRRDRVRRPEDGRAARARAPRSASTGRSSRCPTTRATRSGAPSSTGSSRAAGTGRGGRLRGRPVRRARMRFAGAVLLVARAPPPRWPRCSCTPSGGASCSRSPRPWRRCGAARGWLTRCRSRSAGWRWCLDAPQRDEGDFVISSTSPATRCWCFALVVLVVAVVTLPRPRRVRPGVRRATPPRMTRVSAAMREKAGGKVVLVMLLVLVLLGGAGTPRPPSPPATTSRAAPPSPASTSAGSAPTRRRPRLEDGPRRPDRRADPGDRRRRAGRASTPADAGLSVDYAASVAAAGGEKSWEPGRLWDYYTGGDDLHAGRDRRRGRPWPATVDELVASSGTLPRDGDVAFDEGRVRGRSSPAPVSRSSAEEARAGPRRRRTCTDDETAELSLTAAQPDIDEADVQEALDAFANPAVSAPVTLVLRRTRGCG